MLLWLPVTARQRVRLLMPMAKGRRRLGLRDLIPGLFSVNLCLQLHEELLARVAGFVGVFVFWTYAVFIQTISDLCLHARGGSRSMCSLS